MSPSASKTWAKGSRWGRRVLGGLLILMGLLPGSLLLDPETVGPFGEWVLSLEAESVELTVWGSIIAVGCGFVLARVFGARGIRWSLRHLTHALISVHPTHFALGLGIVSMLLAAGASWMLSGWLPTNVDSMAHLLQSRFLLEGMLAGPPPDPPQSQLMLNTLLTDEGWVSMYPPAHTVLLAGGLLVGAEAWVGPLLTGVTVAASARLFIDLLPDQPGTARLAALLTALSPFVLFIGGGYLSHTSCAVGIALAAWFGHRAGSGNWGWSVATGAATGLAITSRPWTGLAVLSVVLSALWLRKLESREHPFRWIAARAAGATLGGIPFAFALFRYNTHLFGNPTTLGYEAAYGSAHGLGLHQDPWGYPYGIGQALGYTASDLSALSVHLLETPVPLVALVGVFLIGSRRLTSGTGVLLGWALAPVVANFFYWHHGFHLGPRMLYEAAPAWCALIALTVRWTTGPLSGDPSATGSTSTRDGEHDRRRVMSVDPRSFLLWCWVVTLVGPAFLIPARLSGNAWGPETRARMSAPQAGEGPAVVFVHGSWSERVSARLQASGMRFDSLEVALRRNDLCLLERYARARLGGNPLPELDFSAVPGTPPELREIEVPGVGRIRVDPGREMTPGCLQQLRADRRGTVPLAPLLWQGDLAGAEGGAPAFVRDLGPVENRATMAEWPNRTPLLWVPPHSGSPPTLVPYRQGMAKLWGETLPPMP